MRWILLLDKRLEKGKFQWSRSESEALNLTPQQYRWLMEGLSIQQPNRKTENAENFLENFKRYLHTDGYKAYRGIDDVTVVGCWAHARRKFCEALEVLPEAQRKGSVAETP